MMQILMLIEEERIRCSKWKISFSLRIILKSSNSKKMLETMLI